MVLNFSENPFVGRVKRIMDIRGQVFGAPTKTGREVLWIGITADHL